MKPMLAATASLLEEIPLPKLASPKLDGVRALIRDGVVLSRSLKPIPNEWVQDQFGHLHGLDAELIVGSPTAPNAMQATMSGVMSRDGRPDATLWVFDRWDMPEQPFEMRHVRAHAACIDAGMPNVQAVPHTHIDSLQDLDAYEEGSVSLGYEGIMLRCPNGPYKHGRSTVREGWLMKVKRFVDSEAIVTGYEELMHNDNEAMTNALGHTERSTAKAGKRPAGTLGALQVVDMTTGVPFSIGTGFTAAQRAALWAIRDQLPGRIVTYKSFANGGVVEAPRFPVFRSFRDPLDME